MVACPVGDPMPTLRGAAAMTFPEIAVSVGAALAVLGVTMIAAALAYVAIVILGNLSRHRTFRFIRCWRRGHAWLTITCSTYRDGRVVIGHRERFCGCCGRREGLA